MCTAPCCSYLTPWVQQVMVAPHGVLLPLLLAAVAFSYHPVVMADSGGATGGARGPARRLSATAQKTSADVIVIGAGLAGISAARSIADQNGAASVIVLEGRTRVGGRCGGRCAGAHAAVWHAPPPASHLHGSVCMHASQWNGRGGCIPRGTAAAPALPAPLTSPHATAAAASNQAGAGPWSWLERRAR